MKCKQSIRMNHNNEDLRYVILSPTGPARENTNQIFARFLFNLSTCLKSSLSHDDTSLPRSVFSMVLTYAQRITDTM